MKPGELMFATGIGTLVLAAAMAFTVFSAHGLAAVTNYVGLDVRSRGALDWMSQEIRQADAVTVCDSTRLALVGKEPGSGAGYTLTYTYSPTLKTLTRTKGTDSQTMLTQCDSLNWHMYQRNMTKGTDQPIPTSDVNQCKLIKLAWVCSRNILGKSANTESVQSSEIVIRKK